MQDSDDVMINNLNVEYACPGYSLQIFAMLI